MSSIEDVMGDLEERAARDMAAVAFLRRLGKFLSAEDTRGLEIEVETETVGAGALQVALSVRAPAGAVEVPEVELVERESGSSVERAFDAAEKLKKMGQKDSDFSQSGGAVLPTTEKPDASSGQPKRWSKEEDATAVRMAAAGSAVAQIAAELARPLQGTGYRLRRKLRDRVAAARASAAARVDSAPTEGSEPAAAPDTGVGSGPESAPPSDGFTDAQDARLRGYMADGLGLGGAASLLRVPRDRVAARWAALQQEGAA